MIEIYTDGSCSSNPGGVISYAFAVYRDGAEIHRDSGVAGNGTNNQAEFVALIHALEYALKHGFSEITIKSDSALLVNQMQGNWRVKKGAYVAEYERAMGIASKLKVFFVLIPRERNKTADGMARREWG